MNKLEGYYLLALVNSEITRGIITERQYNSYYFLYSIYFSGMSFPKNKPTSRCVELFCQKSCLCITKMPFKVFGSVSFPEYLHYLFPPSLPPFFLQQIFIEPAINLVLKGYRPYLCHYRSLRYSKCHVWMKSPLLPSTFPINANEECSWKDTALDSGSMSSHNWPPFTHVLPAV